LAHSFTVTKFFRGNPRLLLQAVPVAVAMILLKWLYDLSPLKHLDFSPLLTGVIAAEVFIVGFILSGTAADFKEAERLPGEVAGSLDSIADECLIMDAELKLPEARQCVSLLADIAESIRGWLVRNDGYDDVFEHLRRLNPYFIVFAPKIQPGFTTRLKSEQANIRRLVIRMDTMRRTSYVSAGYLIAEVTG
jgi:predicted membrane chloride channel (bestrophin family)